VCVFPLLRRRKRPEEAKSAKAEPPRQMETQPDSHTETEPTRGRDQYNETVTSPV